MDWFWEFFSSVAIVDKFVNLGCETKHSIRKFSARLHIVCKTKSTTWLVKILHRIITISHLVV